MILPSTLRSPEMSLTFRFFEWSLQAFLVSQLSEYLLQCVQVTVNSHIILDSWYSYIFPLFFNKQLTVLHGRETWHLIPSEEYSLSLFENKVTKELCGRNRDEVIVGWKILYIAEFHIFVIKCMTKSKSIRWTIEVGLMGELKDMYKIVLGNPEEIYDLWRIKQVRGKHPHQY
jgi:hypothetical protein